MIKIITDSTAYFRKSEASCLPLKVIPMNYTVNGQLYYESYPDSNGGFETLLRSHAGFTTSQPNMAAFLSAFEEELSLGNEVLCITISSRLSGTYSTAHMAAKQTQSDRVVVFDSQLTGGGLYLLVCEAKELIDKGLSLSEIIKALPRIRDRITVAFSVDDMTPLRNSGRIGFVRMSVGTILNIKPVLLCRDGAVVFDSLARGGAELIKKLVQIIPRGTKKVVVNYIENSRAASNLYNVIIEKYPGINIRLRKMGPVLGIHLGLQVVAVSFITE